MKRQDNYGFALGLIFSLFFLWAISSNLLPTMIRQLMKTCELNTFQASFTQTAYWLAYFIFPIPIAMFMKKYSYKSGIIFGLVIAPLGALFFFPAAIVKSLSLWHFINRIRTRFRFGLYMIILPHEARFCTIFRKNFLKKMKKANHLNMDFQRKILYL